jgi:hypothetical protein
LAEQDSRPFILPQVPIFCVETDCLVPPWALEGDDLVLLDESSDVIEREFGVDRHCTSDLPLVQARQRTERLPDRTPQRMGNGAMIGGRVGVEPE